MTILNNKVAIVTGAGSGIGAAIAEKFAEEGAKVTMMDLNQTKLANVAQQVEKKGAKPLVITGDVTDEDDCRRMLRETVNHFGKLDILVNNAGIYRVGSLADENVMQIFDTVISTNLRPAVFITHIATPHLIETKGNIINISSIAAKKASGIMSFTYGVSKAAVEHFTRCAALELSTKGVRVNVISPGFVKTNLMENAGFTKDVVDKVWESTLQTSCLGQIAEPKEIADLAVFLASDKARSVTGSTYVLDNGGLLK